MKKVILVLFISLQFLVSGCLNVGKDVDRQGQVDTTSGQEPEVVTIKEIVEVLVTQLTIDSPEEGKESPQEETVVRGACESDHGKVLIQGSFKGEQLETDCVKDRYEEKVHFEYPYNDNKLQVVQGEQKVSRLVSVFRRPAYCGDGVVNQYWERCDGGRHCNDTCFPYLVEDDRGIKLARVVFRRRVQRGEGNVTPNVFLGENRRGIPSGAWFIVEREDKGLFSDTHPEKLGDAPGLVVSRIEDELFVRLHGGMVKDRMTKDFGMEHLSGYIEFYNSSPDEVSMVQQYPLEKQGDGICEVNSGQDEVTISNGRINFCLTVTTHHDGFQAAWIR